jgi:hypothetical protein
MRHDADQWVSSADRTNWDIAPTLWSLADLSPSQSGRRIFPRERTFGQPGRSSPKSAMDGSDQTHSITSSASAPKSGGSSIPVAFAVLTWINTAGAGCSNVGTVTTCGRGGVQILARLPRAGRTVRSVKRKQSYRAPPSFGPASIISPCGAPLAALSIMRRCYPIQLREPLCIP